MKNLYSISETRGIYIVVFIFLCIVLNKYPSTTQPHTISPTVAVEESLAEVISTLGQQKTPKEKIASKHNRQRNKSKYKNRPDNKKRQGLKSKPFPEPKKQYSSFKKKQSALLNTTLKKFDPNTVSEQDLARYPLSKYVRKNILKYRNSGGQFYKPEDLLKIYGMEESSYDQLKALIEIKKSKKNKTSATAYHSRKPKRLIQINTADSAALESLSGIGPVLSDRIIKYRDKLGGFHAISQLATTYGLSDSVFQNILPQLRLDPKSIKKISLDTCDQKTLSGHPYISYRQAKVIINYRDLHGPYYKASALLKIEILDSVFVNKLSPYLIFSKSAELSHNGM